VFVCLRYMIFIDQSGFDGIFEKAMAAEAIWALSFPEENKKILKSDEKLMRRLEIHAATSREQYEHCFNIDAIVFNFVIRNLSNFISFF